MLPTREDVLTQLNPYIEETVSYKDLNTIYRAMQNYAEQVIKHCAEVAEFEIFTKSDSDIIESEITNNYYHNDTMSYVEHIEVNKQSILNVLKEL